MKLFRTSNRSELKTKRHKRAASIRARQSVRDARKRAGRKARGVSLAEMFR